MVNSDFFCKISEILSTERLEAYRNTDADDLTTLARYLWNIALCETLYSPLQMAEVVLRNTIHKVFQNRYGVEDWYNAENFSDFTQSKINDARKRIESGGCMVTAGRMIAELNFGFWTTFFNRSYEFDGTASYIIRHGYLNCPRRLRRNRFQEQRWRRIRELRNRVFHHERIILWRDLPTQHAEIIETIGWISPQMQAMSLKLDRFNEMYGAGIDPWIEKIREYWCSEN